MTEIERLSGDQRKLLLNVSVAMGRTADEVLVEEYEETTPDHARGFLECFCQTAPEDKVLLTYFIVRMLLTKE